MLRLVQLPSPRAPPRLKLILVWYQKDNDTFDPWLLRLLEAAARAVATDEQQQKRRKLTATTSTTTATTSTPTPPTPTPLTPTHTANSPFNPNLFCRDPNTNLCCLMLFYSFPGFTSASWYVKTDGSFFCMHVEQLFAPFYNLCYEGSTTWWVVK